MSRLALAAITSIARVCHEANRAYCASLGDTSQPAWEEAPDWQKESAVAGVQHAIFNPDAPPSASHESWLAQKQADGWKYGPVKDPVKKEHPCFVPYEHLPAEQKAKDYIFLAIARAMAPKPIEYCDVCPHNLALHNPDGSCGCGTNCAAIRKGQKA